MKNISSIKWEISGNSRRTYLKYKKIEIEIENDNNPCIWIFYDGEIIYRNAIFLRFLNPKISKKDVDNAKEFAINFMEKNPKGFLLTKEQIEMYK